MTPRSDPRYTATIARAEDRASRDLALGVAQLRQAISEARWPWERQPMERLLERLESA